MGNHAGWSPPLPAQGLRNYEISPSTSGDIREEKAVPSDRLSCRQRV